MRDLEQFQVYEVTVLHAVFKFYLLQKLQILVDLFIEHRQFARNMLIRSGL